MSRRISVLVFFEGPPTAAHETPQMASSQNAPNRFSQRILPPDHQPGQATSNLPANAKSTGKAMIGGQS